VLQSDWLLAVCLFACLLPIGYRLCIAVVPAPVLPAPVLALGHHGNKYIRKWEQDQGVAVENGNKPN
jgi:hypothetical protein